MRIEGTPKEIADFMTELQSRLNKFETTVKLDDEKLNHWKGQVTSTSRHKLFGLGEADDLPPIGGLH